MCTLRFRFLRGLSMDEFTPQDLSRVRTLNAGGPQLRSASSPTSESFTDRQAGSVTQQPSVANHALHVERTGDPAVLRWVCHHPDLVHSAPGLRFPNASETSPLAVLLLAGRNSMSFPNGLPRLLFLHRPRPSQRPRLPTSKAWSISLLDRSQGPMAAELKLLPLGKGQSPFVCTGHAVAALEPTIR